jgi:hypothetical protein
LTPINFKHWCNLEFDVDDYIEYIDVKTEEPLFDGVFNWYLYDFLVSILSQISMTLQVNDSLSKNNEKFSVTAGPVHVDQVFEWLTDLDKIFLDK